MTDSNEPTFQEKMAALVAAINAFGETIRQGLTKASGGAIQGPRPDDDSIPAQLSPGYVSWDGGQTWQEERA
jgi:hypothetical protein